MTTNNINALCMGCMKEKNAEGKCPFCGFEELGYNASPHHLPLRTILGGKYLVGRVLGEGGFGITYLGWDLNLDIKIAIKEYYPTGFVTRENTTTNTVMPYVGEKEQFFVKGCARFVDEAKSLAKFYALPGIVSVKDFFLENGTAYIVMEFVEGETLKQLLTRSDGRLPADQVFEMMKPLMRSLSEIHKAGIIHRDISPDNLMVTKGGSVKLLDFGAARSYEESGNKSLSVLLKPGYAPEEQYRSRGIQGPWTDVYALCATMYRAITGITPMESIERTRHDEVITPSKLGIYIQPQQEAALMKGMAVLQENRYNNIDELDDGLYSLKNNTAETSVPGFVGFQAPSLEERKSENVPFKLKPLEDQQSFITADSIYKNKKTVIKNKKNIAVILLSILSFIMLCVVILLSSQLNDAIESENQYGKKYNQLSDKINDFITGGMSVRIDGYSNINKDGKVLDNDIDSKSLKYLDIKYSIFTIDNISNYYGKNMKVCIYQPDGSLNRGTNSPSDCSFLQEISGGTGDEGWGSDTGGVYTTGWYKIVIKYNEEIVGSDAVYIK